MRRRQFSSLFWGIVVIILGSLLLLKTQGVLRGDVFGYFWPLLVMMFGLWIFLGYFLRPGDADLGEGFTVNLGDAQEAEMRFSYGAAQVEITGGAPVNVAVDGNSGVGMNISSHVEGNTLKAKVEAGPSFIPFLGPGEGMWRFRLTDTIPLALKVESGASSLLADLTNLKVKSFKLDTGASSVHINLPQNANSMILDIDGGATSIHISMPQGVEGRVKVDGVMALDLDHARFTQQSSGYYETAGYAAATNRVDIKVDGGAGSITIK